MSAKTTAIKRVIGTRPGAEPGSAIGQRLWTDSAQRLHAGASLAQEVAGTDFGFETTKDSRDIVSLV
jgi:hypothetical protein